jgi:flagellar hook-basal body complex protein FliE
MSLKALDALSAYGQTLARPGFGGGGLEDMAGASGAGGPGSFASMIEAGFSSAVETTRAAEVASAQSLSGKADLMDVVSAVNNAEIALETVVAVRDRMINAYQEIMRMPI